MRHLKKSMTKKITQKPQKLYETSTLKKAKSNIIASIKNEAGVITDDEDQITSTFHGKNLRTLQKWRKKSTGT